MGSKCCKCSEDKKGTTAHRSSSTHSSLPRNRVRRRMVGGDDVELEDLPEDDRWPEQQQWTGTGRPHLVRRLSDLSVKVGTRARFLVEVSSPTPVSVRWEKDGRTVDEGDRIRMVTEGNFHCVDISPVFLEDSGLWRVIVTNIVGTTISSGQLTLLIPKAYKKPEFVEPLRAILTAQGTVSLECKVVGVPTPLLRWFKGGVEIKAGDVLALTPNQADPTSLGTYTCLATNCMGSTESSSIVHVDASSNFGQSFLPVGPKPNLLKELRNEKSKLGGNITFECKVSVPPWPEAVTWYGPSGEITENAKYQKVEDGTGGYKLRISEITAEDNGVWKCVASNKTGAKAISSANLIVSYPKNYRKPKFLENLKAILTEEGLVSFECKVVGYPTPHLSWFKDGQELKPGDVYQLTGTNSLGSYCCIAKNCMGEAESTAVLTLDDIKSQLTEEDRLQLSSERLPPRFIQGLKSAEAKINENYKFTVQVSVFPEPTILWFKDDEIIETNEKYKVEREKLGICQLVVNKLEFSDQAEWKCVATNDYGQSVTSCFLKLNIPKHFKKPKFLEDLKAVMSEEGAVNLECKVIGVPQPKLKWFKDGRELKPGDIHKIITGQDGTCCLGTYTCLAQNCMGSVSSSASLLGFEDKGGKTSTLPDSRADRQNALTMDRSLSTIHEERTSQLHDTTSGTIDDRAEEVSFSFDGKEVSVSLYETPDLTEEEALQIVEMYAEQISEHVSEHNVVELPPMRFTKESSNSGKLLMEAVVIDVSPEYFNTAAFTRRPILEDDLRTDVDMEELSFVEEDQTIANLTPDEVMTREKLELDFASMTDPPTKPPRAKHKIADEDKQAPQKEPAPMPRKRAKKKSTDSEKEDDSLKEFERRKKSQMQRKRTESELEDDSLYEFESRKKEEIRKSSPETGVAQTTENESVFFTAAKSPELASAASKKSEDEATFDTAEDSAFDRSEVSVLESLALSLQEFQREIANVDGQATSDEELHSALAQPLQDVQKSLEAVEAQIESSESPLASHVFETLKQPLADFQLQVAESIESQNMSSLMQSVQRPLEILTHEVTQHLEHEKSVEQVQANLTKMIEREASVPGGDKQVRESLSKELLDLEEKANDELERFYDRLLTVGTDLRHKANQETDEEIVDILRSVGDLIKPLKKLSAVTSKVIGIIVEDSEAGTVPSKKTVESLTKPLDALHVAVTLLENVSMLRSHRAIRGAGIPALYKVTVPMDELHTTVKLVENLSAHSAVDFLTPPLENLIKVLADIDITSAGEGFLEDLPREGIPIVKTVEDSLDIIVNCLGSIEKGVLMDDTERGIANKMPALIRPIEELQKALKAVEREILNPHATEDESHSVAHEVSRPLQSIRSEFSILQHEIEADCSPSSPSPVRSALADLVEPLESVQNCINSFHEAVICKAAEDPIHLRFVMYALKEMCEPLNALCEKIIKTEETLLGRGDPYRGLRAVARSVSELRESSVALTRESSVAERMSEPLGAVQTQLEKLIALVEKDALSGDLLKCLIEPIRELQYAVVDVEGVLDESSAPDLYVAVKDLQSSILSVQESKDINEIYRLAEPIQALRTQFSEMQRVLNKSVIKADKAISALLECIKRASATVNSLKQNRKGTPMGQVLESLGETIEEIESVVELNSGYDNRVENLTVIIDNTLQSSLIRLTDICAKADNLCATVEQKRRKSFVHMQDLIHDLKSGLEHSSTMLTLDTLSSIAQLTSTIAGFHGRLMSVEDLAVEGVSALKQQTDRLDNDLEVILRTGLVDKSNKLVLETVITDIRSVQRVVDNLVQENSTDSARLRFVMTKIKAIVGDLEDINKHYLSDLIKQACRTGLSAINVAEALFEGKTKPETVQTEDSVIGELLEVVDELESRLVGGEHAEDRISDGLASLRVTIQRIATGASGGLLDQTGEICEPLKWLSGKLVEKEYDCVISSIEGINERLDALLMPKQATTSIIGELLENVNDLDVTFEKFKTKIKNVTRESLNQVEREIIALQNMVDEITSQVSGDLLDKAYEICIPVKSIEAILMRVSTASQNDVFVVSNELGEINRRLIEAKDRCLVEKHKREKEFEKLFSSESLNLAVDVPIVKSIVKTIEFMQAHLDTIKVDRGKETLKDFLNKFESHIIQFGECLVMDQNESELIDSINYMEETLASFKDDRKEIRILRDTVSKLKSSEHTMSSILPVLQAVLTPLRELHEELSRPGSPREVKKAEIKYLDDFTKQCLAIEDALSVSDASTQVSQLVSPVEQLIQTIEQLSEEELLKSSDEESITFALRSLAGPINHVRDVLHGAEQAVASKQNSRVTQLLSELVEPIEEITTRVATLQERVSVQEISLNQIEELKQAVSLMTKVPDESPELKAPLMTLHARLHDLDSDHEMSEVVSEISGPVESLKQAVDRLESRGEHSILLEMCHQMIDIIHRSSEECSEISSVEQSKANERLVGDLTTAFITSPDVRDLKTNVLKLIAEVSEEERTLMVPLGRLRDKLEKNEDVKSSIVELKRAVTELNKCDASSMEKYQRIIDFAQEQVISEINGFMTVGDFIRIIDLIECDSSEITSSLAQVKSSLEITDPEALIGEISDSLKDQISELKKALPSETPKGDFKICWKLIETVQSPVKVDLKTVGDLKEAVETSLAIGLPQELQHSVTDLLGEINSFGPLLPIETTAENLKIFSDVVVQKINSLENVKSYSGIGLFQQVTKAIETSLIQNAVLATQAMTVQELKTIIHAATLSRLPAAVEKSIKALQAVVSEIPSEATIDSVAVPLEESLAALKETLTLERLNNRVCEKIVEVIEKPLVLKAVSEKPNTIGELQRVVRILSGTQSKPFITEALKALNAILEPIEPSAPLATAIFLEGPLESIVEQIKEIQKTPIEGEFVKHCKEIIQAIKQNVSKSIVSEFSAIGQTSTVGDIQNAIATALTQSLGDTKIVNVALEPMQAELSRLNPEEKIENVAEKVMESAKTLEKEIESGTRLATEVAKMCAKIVEVIVSSQKAQICTTEKIVPSNATAIEIRSESDNKSTLIPDVIEEEEQKSIENDVKLPESQVQESGKPEIQESEVEGQILVEQEIEEFSEFQVPATSVTVAQLQQIVQQAIISEPKQEILENTLRPLQASLEQLNPETALEVASSDLKKPLKALEIKMESVQESKQKSLCSQIVEVIKIPVLKAKVEESLKGHIATVGELQEVIEAISQMSSPVSVEDPIVSFKAEISALQQDTRLESVEIERTVDNLMSHLSNVESPDQVRYCRQLIDVIKASVEQRGMISTPIKTEAIAENRSEEEVVREEDVKTEPLKMYVEQRKETVEAPEPHKSLLKPKTVGEVQQIVNVIMSSEQQVRTTETPVAQIKATLDILNPETPIEQIDIKAPIQELGRELQKLEGKDVELKQVQLCRHLVEVISPQAMAPSVTTVGELQQVVRNLVQMTSQSVKVLDAPLIALQASLEHMDPNLPLETANISQQAEEIDSILTDLEVEGNKSVQVNLCRQVVDIIQAPVPFQATETAALTSVEQRGVPAESEVCQESIERGEVPKESKAIEEILSRKPRCVAELKEIIDLTEEISGHDINLESLKTTVALLTPETPLLSVNLTEPVKHLKDQLERMEIQRVKEDKVKICRLLVNTLSVTPAQATITELIAQKPTKIGELQTIVQELAAVQTISTVELALQTLKVKIETLDSNTPIESAEIEQPLQVLSAELSKIETEGNKLQEIVLCHQLIDMIPATCFLKASESTTTEPQQAALSDDSSERKQIPSEISIAEMLSHKPAAVGELKEIIAVARELEGEVISLDSLHSVIAQLSPETSLGTINIADEIENLKAELERIKFDRGKGKKYELCQLIVGSLSTTPEKAAISDILDMKPTKVGEIRNIVHELSKMQTISTIQIHLNAINAQIEMLDPETSVQEADLSQPLQALNTVLDRVEADGNKAQHIKLCKQLAKILTPQLTPITMTKTTRLAEMEPIIAEISYPELKLQVNTLQNAIKRLDSNATIDDVAGLLQGPARELSTKVEKLRKIGVENDQIKLCSLVAETILMPVAKTAEIVDVFEVKQLKTVEDLKLVVRGLSQIAVKLDIEDTKIAALVAKIDQVAPFIEVFDDLLTESLDVATDLTKQTAVSKTVDLKEECKYVRQLIEAPVKQKADVILNTGLSTVGELKSVVNVLLHAPDKPEILNQKLDRLNAKLSELKPEEKLNRVLDLTETLNAIKKSVESLRIEGNKTHTLQMCSKMVAVAQSAIVVEPFEIPSEILFVKELAEAINKIESIPQKPEVIKQGLQMLKGELSQVRESESIKSEQVQKPLEKFSKIVRAVETTGDESEALKQCLQLIEASKSITETFDMAKIKAQLETGGAIKEQIREIVRVLGDEPNKPQKLNESIQLVRGALDCLPQDTDLISLQLALEEPIHRLSEDLKETKGGTDVAELCKLLVEATHISAPRCSGDLLVLIKHLENHPKKSKLLDHSIGELKNSLKVIPEDTTMEKVLNIAGISLQGMNVVSSLLDKAGFKSEPLRLCHQITSLSPPGSMDSISVLTNVISSLEDSQQPHSLNQAIKSLHAKLKCLPEEGRLEEHFSAVKEEFNKLDNVVVRLGKVGSSTETISACHAILNHMRPLLILEKGVWTVSELRSLTHALSQSVQPPAIMQALTSITKELEPLNQESLLTSNMTTLESLAKHLERFPLESKKLQQVAHIIQNPTSQAPVILRATEALAKQKIATTRQLLDIVSDIDKIPGPQPQKSKIIRLKLKEFALDDHIEMSLSQDNLKNLDQTLELIDDSVTHESLMKQIAKLGKSSSIGDLINVIDSNLSLTSCEDEHALRNLRNQLSNFPAETSMSNINLTEPMQNYQKSLEKRSKSGEKILETLKSAHLGYLEAAVESFHTVKDTVEVINCLAPLEKSKILESSLEKLKTKLMVQPPESSIQNTAEAVLVDLKALKQSMGRSTGEAENLTKRLIHSIEKAALISVSKRLDSIVSVHDLVHVVRTVTLLADDDSSSHFKKLTERLQSLDGGTKLNECALQVDTKSLDSVKGDLKDSAAKVVQVVKKAREDQIAEAARLVEDMIDVASLKQSISALSQCVSAHLQPIFGKILGSLSTIDNSVKIESIIDNVASDFELLKQAVPKFEVSPELNKICSKLMETIDAPLRLKKAQSGLNSRSSVGEVIAFIDVLVPLEQSKPFKESLSQLRAQLVLLDRSAPLESTADQLQSAAQFVETTLPNTSPVAEPCRQLIGFIREPVLQKSVSEDLNKTQPTAAVLMSALQKLSNLRNTPPLLTESVRELLETLKLQNPDDRVEAIALCIKEPINNTIKSFSSQNSEFEGKSLYKKLVKVVEGLLIRASLINEAKEAIAARGSAENLMRAITCLNNIPDKEQAVQDSLKTLESNLTNSKCLINPGITQSIENLEEAAKQCSTLDSAVSDLCLVFVKLINESVVDDLTNTVARTVGELKAVTNLLIKEPAIAETARQIQRKINPMANDLPLDMILSDLKPMVAHLQAIASSEDKSSAVKLCRQIVSSVKHHETVQLIKSTTVDNATAGYLENLVANLHSLQEPNRDKLTSLHQILKQFDSNESMDVLAEHLEGPLSTLEKVASTALTKLFIASVQPVVRMALVSSPLLAIVESEKYPNVKQVVDILTYAKQEVKLESIDKVLAELEKTKTQNLDDSLELLAVPLSNMKHELNSVKPNQSKSITLCEKLLGKILPRAERRVKIVKAQKLIQNQLTTVGQLAEISEAISTVEPKFQNLTAELNNINSNIEIENASLSKVLSLLESSTETAETAALVPILQKMDDVIRQAASDQRKLEEVEKLLERRISTVQHMMQIVDGLSSVSRKPAVLENGLKKLQAELSQSTDIGQRLKTPLVGLQNSVESLEIEGNKSNLIKLCRKMISEAEMEISKKSELEELEKLIDVGPKTIRDLSEIIDKLNDKSGLEQCFTQIKLKLDQFRPDDDINVIFGAGLDVTSLSTTFADCKSSRLLQISLRLVKYLQGLYIKMQTKTKIDSLIKRDIVTIGDLADALEAILDNASVKSSENINLAIAKLQKLGKNAPLDSVVESLPPLKLDKQEELSRKVTEALESAERRMESLKAAQVQSHNLAKLENVREVIQKLVKARLWNEKVIMAFRDVENLMSGTLEPQALKSALDRLTIEISQTNEDPEVMGICERLIQFATTAESTGNKIKEIENNMMHLFTVSDLKKCVASLLTLKSDQKTIEQCLVVILEKLEKISSEQELTSVAEDLAKPIEALNHNLKFIDDSTQPDIKLTQKLVKSVKSSIIDASKISKISRSVQSQTMSLGDLKQIVSLLEQVVPCVATDDTKHLLQEIEACDLKQPIAKTPDNIIGLFEGLHAKVKTASCNDKLTEACQGLADILQKSKEIVEVSKKLKFKNLENVEQLLSFVESLIKSGSVETLLKPLQALKVQLQSHEPDRTLNSVDLASHVESIEREMESDSGIAEPCREMIRALKEPILEKQADSLIKQGIEKIKDLMPVLQILLKLPSRSSVLNDSLSTLLKKSERLSPDDSIETTILEPIKILDKLVSSLEKEVQNDSCVLLARKTVETVQAPITERRILTEVNEKIQKGRVKTIKDLQQIVQSLSQIPNKPPKVTHGLLNVLRHMEQFEPDSKLDAKFQTLEPALDEFEQSLSGLHSTQMTTTCQQIVQILKTDRSWISEVEGLLKVGMDKAGQALLIIDTLNKHLKIKAVNENLTILVSKLSLTPPTTELDIIADKLTPTIDSLERSLPTDMNVEELKLCNDIVKVVRTGAEVQTTLLKAEGLLNKRPVTAGELNSIVAIFIKCPRISESLKRPLTEIQTQLTPLKDHEPIFSSLNKLVGPVEILEKALVGSNEESKAPNLANQLLQLFRHCSAQQSFVKQAEEVLKTGQNPPELKTVARILNQIEHKPKVVQDYLLEINEQLDSSTSDSSLAARFNQLQPVIKNLKLSTAALKKEGCKWLGLGVCESFVNAATKLRPEKQKIERIILSFPKVYNSNVSTVTKASVNCATMTDIDEVLQKLKDIKTAKTALDWIIDMPQRIKTLDDSLKSLGELIDRGIDESLEQESEERIKKVEKCLSSLDSKFKRSGVAKICQEVVNVVRQCVASLKSEKRVNFKDGVKSVKKDLESTKLEEKIIEDKCDNVQEVKKKGKLELEPEVEEKIKLKLEEMEVPKSKTEVVEIEQTTAVPRIITSNIVEEENELKKKIIDESKARIDNIRKELCEPQFEYTSTVTTKTKPNDIGVHSTRGITVVELMDYQPPDEDERPQRRYRRFRPSDSRAKQLLLREYKSQDYLPMSTAPVRGYAKKYAMSAESIPSQDVGKAYKWDRSKEQNWKHLEFSTADVDFESPSNYHRSRRPSSPYRDIGGSLLLDATRYQPTPARSSSRGRRSMSPFEKALTTTSYSNLSLSSSRRHLDQLTSTRIRPPTPTRSMTPTRSRSIGKLDLFERRAYICNGLCDKTVVHGGRIRLTCNITGDSEPSIDWLKDGKPISLHTESSRYKTSWNFGVAALEVDNAILSDSGQYTCIVKNVDGQAATTCTVRVVLKDDDDDSKPWETIESELEANMPREICLSIKGADIGMPRVTGLLADPVVPSGGTIAVHVQVAGCHRPEVTWLHAGNPLPRYSPRVHYLVDGGLYTLLLEGATPSESGVYTCRVFGGRRGAVDTTTTIQVVERRAHEKPAQFTVRPDTRMTLSSGEDMTVTCYVSGEPRPQVFLMRGIKDITTSCRTLKETFGEYVRLTLKRVTSDDRGTYFIMARNIYGTDRAFVTLEVRERARSQTPSRWLERTSSLSSILKETSGSQSLLSHWKSYSSAIHSSYSSLYE